MFKVSMTLFVSANTYQGVECFNTQSRGKQCAFMSLSAILTGERIPLFEWSQSTIDNILVQGDYMYVKALNNGLFGINPGIEPKHWRASMRPVRTPNAVFHLVSIL